MFWPNLYIVLVGPAATGKGTAMAFAKKLQDSIADIHTASNATSLQALIRTMKSINSTDTRADGKIAFHSSLTIFSQEFTVFLGYKQNAMIANLCDWFDCHERWIYDTISRDKEEIIGVWVNLLAATTPENILASLPMEAIGGGLTSRIIFVVERKRRKTVVFPKRSGELDILESQLINDLDNIKSLSGEFTFTRSAAERYYDFAIKNSDDPPFKGDLKLEHYVGRRRRHLLATAMCMSAARSSSMLIDLSDMERAIALLEGTEVKMAGIFRGMDSPYAMAYAEIEDFLELAKTIKLSELWKHFAGMDARIFTSIYESLCRAKRIDKVITANDTIIKWRH